MTNQNLKKFILEDDINDLPECNQNVSIELIGQGTEKEIIDNLELEEEFDEDELDEENALDEKCNILDQEDSSNSDNDNQSSSKSTKVLNVSANNSKDIKDEKKYFLVEYDNNLDLNSKQYQKLRKKIISNPDKSDCLAIFDIDKSEENKIFTNEISLKDFNSKKKDNEVQFFELTQDLISRLQYGKLLSTKNLTNRKISTIIMLVIYEQINNTNQGVKMTINQRVTNLENRMTNLENRMTNVENRITSLENSVQTISVDLANLNQKVDGLIIAFQDFAKKVDERLDRIEAKVDKLEVKVEENSKDIKKILNAVVELQEIHIKAGDKIENKLEKVDDTNTGGN